MRLAPVIAVVLLSIPTGAIAQARWHVSYRRTCDQVVVPVPSPDGQHVLACTQIFGARGGAFRGRGTIGTLAVLRDGAIVAQDYSVRGVVLFRRSTAISRGAGGMVQRLALSPSERFVATVEDSVPGTALIVRELPSLRRLRLVPVRPAITSGFALSVDDRGNVVWSMPSADSQSFAGLAALDARGVTSQLPHVDGPFVSAALSSDGSTRVLVARDGSVSVSRPQTSPPAPLPAGRGVTDASRRVVPVGTGVTGALRRVARADTSDRVDVAIDSTGRRIAVLDRAGLRIFDVGGTTVIPLFDAPIGGSPMVFAPRGERLFLGGSSLIAIGPEAARSWSRPRYAPHLPEGWENGVVRNGVLTFPSHAGSEWAADPAQVAAFAESEGGAMVTAIATEAAELSGNRALPAWAHAVLTRYEPHSPLESTADRSRQPFRAYRDAEGRRTVDLTVPADGCDPSFRWVRFVEMGDSILRVVVRVPLSMEREDQDALRRAFLDGPFGAPVAASDSGRRERRGAR